MSKLIVKFDFETRSEIPIKHGRMPYLHHPSADIMCLAWKVGGSPTQLWLPGQPVPYPFLDPDKYTFAAFNAAFDQAVVNIIGPRYGFPFLKVHQLNDVMAVAARFGLPQSLEALGSMLKVSMPKMSKGKYYVRKCCTPPFKFTDEDFKGLCDYCIRDVDAMSECMEKMPADKLLPYEQGIWEQTALLNTYGIPVDTKSVARINEVINYFTEKKQPRLAFVTGGAVQTVGQNEKFKDWLETHGVLLKNMQAGTIKDLMADHASGRRRLPEVVVDALELRQLLGGAAVKKFKRFEYMPHAGVLNDILVYHGAGTGRTTSKGLQFLNLSRAKVKDPEAAIKSFYDLSVLKDGNPMDTAKKLIRPMFKASNGKTYIVIDWSSIEYILLMWYCGELAKVEAFRGGEDQYIRFASKMFGINYEEVDDEQRQRAKAPVLGSGYTLGANGLIGYAEGYGIDMTPEEAQFATDTFRTDHPLVVATWKELEQAAHSAVKYFNQPFETHNTTFMARPDRTGRKWLSMTLPSGRVLYYCNPRIGAGKYGPTIFHDGIDPYTKKWGKKYLNMSRIIENVIQALGRDILQTALGRVIDNKFNVVGHVYDEIIAMEPTDNIEFRFRQMESLMCIPPEWAPTLPLKVSGYISTRYKKD